MANFGLSKPIIAKLDVANETYSDAVKCGNAMNTSVTPNYNDASLFADNIQQEAVNEFKNAEVELGVDTVPAKAVEMMYGHKIGENGEETSNTNDSGAYVGYGFNTISQTNGIRQYRACFLPKVKFKEGAESYQTKGDNIQFQTPTISGVATSNSKGDWRKKSPYFDTEAECDEWILEQMGLTGTEQGA